MSDEFESYKPRKNVSVTVPAAIFALGLGIIAGAIVGYVANSLFSEPEINIPPPVVLKEEISEEDLMELCEELTDEEKARVLEVQDRVRSLQEELADKEAELGQLREQQEVDEAQQVEARRVWREMEAEVASLRVQLAEAEAERDELRVELTETLQDLDRQIAETNRYKQEAIRYKEESTVNLWSAFLNNAKVQICDRGSRRRHAKCHESVELALSSEVRERFTTCVDTYQAVPVLQKAEKDEPLPQFAMELPEDNRFTRKGWFISFCDPTLPEARDPGLDLNFQPPTTHEAERTTEELLQELGEMDEDEDLPDFNPDDW